MGAQLAAVRCLGKWGTRQGTSLAGHREDLGRGAGFPALQGLMGATPAFLAPLSQFSPVRSDSCLLLGSGSLGELPVASTPTPHGFGPIPPAR